jgi:isoquinoline 1-oxidoreductase alpha subunit
MVAFTLNGKPVSVNTEPTTPLLWVIREQLKLTGTKYGCGSSLCGACTVHVNGAAVRSCVTPVSAVGGARVVTIEGLSPDSSHPLQKAWIAEQVPQCGYCQSGQIMQAAALLARTPKPTRAQIVAHMDGNICRCGTYHRIIAAIERASREG